MLLPFQPYAALPYVLGSAEVVVTILEPEAGVYSVPSKVLTYHCAGRPLLAGVPRENLAGRIIERNGSGIVVDPTDADKFVGAAEELLADDALRRRMAQAGRRYAERTFDIAWIGDAFESILQRLR
jgi:glycosyltransferase involved in cell wall biosynthesis